MVELDRGLAAAEIIHVQNPADALEQLVAFGGLTLEGRYTLAELFARLRNAGYLRAVGAR